MPPNRKPKGSGKDAKGKGTGGQFASKPVAAQPPTDDLKVVDAISMPNSFLDAEEQVETDARAKDGQSLSLPSDKAMKDGARTQEVEQQQISDTTTQLTTASGYLNRALGDFFDFCKKSYFSNTLPGTFEGLADAAKKMDEVVQSATESKQDYSEIKQRTEGIAYLDGDHLTRAIIEARPKMSKEKDSHFLQSWMKTEKEFVEEILPNLPEVYEPQKSEDAEFAEDHYRGAISEAYDQTYSLEGNPPSTYVLRIERDHHDKAKYYFLASRIDDKGDYTRPLQLGESTTASFSEMRKEAEALMDEHMCHPLVQSRHKVDQMVHYIYERRKEQARK